MYSIIEFTTKTMGPLYIYRKDIFEKFVKKYLKRMNNTELRHSLYNELLQYATERIIHHDNWQYKTSRYLMAHSIIWVYMPLPSNPFGDAIKHPDLLD